MDGMYDVNDRRSELTSEPGWCPPGAGCAERVCRVPGEGCTVWRWLGQSPPAPAGSAAGALVTLVGTLVHRWCCMRTLRLEGEGRGGLGGDMQS